MDKNGIKMVVTLVVIAVVVALALSFVNAITKDKIAMNTQEKLEKALQTVLEADSFTVVSESEDATVYEAKQGGAHAGYCVLTAAQGYGGEIQILVGVGTDGAVSGIDIVSHTETAGLGAKADTEDFKGQYAGKMAGNLAVVKNSPAGNEIKAISGATITSKAVTDAVNRANHYIEEATK